MKLVVAGSRKFTKLSGKELEDTVRYFVADAVVWWGDVDEIISGGAPGVDSLVEKMVRGGEFGSIRFTLMPAAWDNLDAPGALIRISKSGKLYNVHAGFDRNQQMAKAGDALLAIWDGESNGTKDMIERMHALGKPSIIIKL